MSLIPATGTPSAANSSMGNSDTSTCSERGAPKKKRSRVTKEQLTHLERLFEADCSPTTARRREIAAQTGIPERQIQIWFQNRYTQPHFLLLKLVSDILFPTILSSRAKAKNTVGRSKAHRTAPPLTTSLPKLDQACQAGFAALIQEDDRKNFIQNIQSLLFLLNDPQHPSSSSRAHILALVAGIALAAADGTFKPGYVRRRDA